MSTAEIFLVVMPIIFAVPYMALRLGRIDHCAPLVVVQINAGIALGPGLLGAEFPDHYTFVFNPTVVQTLNGTGWWAVMLFGWLAGRHRARPRPGLVAPAREQHHRSAGAGRAAAAGLRGGRVGLLATGPGWMAPSALHWQFVAGIGTAYAVTALPILILLLEELELFRTPIGQRVLRYASLDDVAIWGVLALILLDWQRVGRQAGFLLVFALASLVLRKLIVRLPAADRWPVGLIWLILCALGADWCGLHFMVGAFLAGAVIDAHWFKRDQLDALRRHVLLIVMPVFFLSTGLRTNWAIGGPEVLLAAAALLLMAVVSTMLTVPVVSRIDRARS